MSERNLEVVRAGVDAFVLGDIEALVSIYHPEARVTAVPEGWPEPAPVEGRDAVIRQFARLQEDWEHHTMEIGRAAAERDWVVIEVHWHTRGAGSGVSLDTTVMAAFRLADAVIVEARFFWDWADALETAGLSEQDAHAES